MAGNQQSGLKYDSAFRQEAKAIYMKHRSLAACHRELGRRGHKLDIKTLRHWMIEEDWKDTLNLRDQVVEPNYDANLGELDKLLKSHKAILTIAQSKIVRKLADGTVQIQSAENQEFHAYNRLAETYGKLLENKRRAEALAIEDTPVEVIFAAMKKHLKFGKLLDSSVIRAELQDLIAREMMQRHRAAVGIKG